MVDNRATGSDHRRLAVSEQAREDFPLQAPVVTLAVHLKDLADLDACRLLDAAVNLDEGNATQVGKLLSDGGFAPRRAHREGR